MELSKRVDDDENDARKKFITSFTLSMKKKVERSLFVRTRLNDPVCSETLVQSPTAVAYLGCRTPDYTSEIKTLNFVTHDVGSSWMRIPPVEEKILDDRILLIYGWVSGVS